MTKPIHPPYSLFSRSRTLATGLLLSFAAASFAVAADSPAPAPPPKKWDTTVTVGATLTRGNSKTFAASALVNTKRSWTNDEVLVGGSAGYGENTVTVNNNTVDKTSESYIKGYAQWNHLFSPHAYGGLRITGEHDDIAALTYRATVGPLFGYYFIKQSDASLSAEAGPSYVREKFFGEEVHNYISLRIGERGEKKFESGVKLWESVEYLPKVQDFQNYLLTAEAGVSAPLSKALSLSLIVQDCYKSVPALHKQSNDLKLITGLSYSF